MRTARSWIVGLLLAAAFTPVTAQSQDQNQNQQAIESRAALLAAERDQKQAELTPPERSRVERALYRYDNGAGALPFVLQSWHGLQLASGSFPAGAGTSFGTRFMIDLGRVRPAADPDRPNRVEIDTVAAYSTRGYSRAVGGPDAVSRLGGAPLDVRVRGQHYEYPQEDFFGFGQDSHEGRPDQLSAAKHGRRRRPAMEGRHADRRCGRRRPTSTRRIGSRALTAVFPRPNELFKPSTIPGYQQQPDFLRSDASVALDWRDNPLHPHAGGRYGVQFSDYRDRDLDAFGFRRVAIDLQQYVPIPDRYRTIALHAAAIFTDPRTGQDVPFYFEPTLGGAQALRGFREFRFRDRNSLLLTAEYRWEAWWALDGALFVDAGQVAAAGKISGSAISTSRTASASASTATAPSWRAWIWRSAAKASFRS